ncbi:MAG: hypothetical protein FJ276_08975 [Planctomycetes bacterium]|nr:hypothetical protein [Planctomycetota bacterium]
MRSSRTQRRGYTLVEMLAILPAVSIILGTVAVTMHAMARTDHQIRDVLDEQLQLEFFVAQLRSDTHEAVSAQVSDRTDPAADAPDLRLTLADGSVVLYRSFTEHIERTVLRNDACEHRETYRLSAVEKGAWSIDGQSGGPLVSVRLRRRIDFGTFEHVDSTPIEVRAAVHLIHHEPISEIR